MKKVTCPKCDSVQRRPSASYAMLYFTNDEERAERVERTFEELHRKPAPAKTAAFVLLTGPPGIALPVTAKPKLTLVAKPK